jgi:hypothetical protein
MPMNTNYQQNKFFLFTLPDPTTCKGRILVISNNSGNTTLDVTPAIRVSSGLAYPAPGTPTTKTFSQLSQSALSGGGTTSNMARQVMIQSDGTQWVAVMMNQDY